MRLAAAEAEHVRPASAPRAAFDERAMIAVQLLSPDFYARNAKTLAPPQPRVPSPGSSRQGPQSILAIFGALIDAR